MTPRQHAHLARLLINACGGLQEAASACRVSDSNLSRYQTVGEGTFMPADVIADLEAYCGEPLYSRALFEARPSATLAACLVEEGCEAAEAATELQKEIRLATKDGKITEAERRRLANLQAKAAEEIRQVGDLIA